MKDLWDDIELSHISIFSDATLEGIISYSQKIRTESSAFRAAVEHEANEALAEIRRRENARKERQAQTETA